MQTINQLCLLRLSAIGDVSHAVAMVSAIQAQQPHIKITWIIGKIEYELVKYVPDVEFIIFDKKQGRAAYQSLKVALNGRKFDVLFAMQVALRANLATFFIRAKRKIGFDWSRSKELHSVFINDAIAPQRHCHVLDGFLGFAKSIGVKPPESLTWNIQVPKAIIDSVAQRSKPWGRYVVINPAASKAERNWLPERYAQTAEYMSDKGFTVVLTGGPGKLDRTLADDILQRTSVNCVDLVGKTQLIELLEILRYATLVIAPDTGPAHMATMVSTPVIGLYAHSNPRRTGPYLSLDYCVSVYDEVIRDQRGQPWETLNWGTRARGEGLMARIEVEQVLNTIDKLLLSLPN